MTTDLEACEQGIHTATVLTALQEAEPDLPVFCACGKVEFTAGDPEGGHRARLT